MRSQLGHHARAGLPGFRGFRFALLPLLAALALVEMLALALGGPAPHRALTDPDSLLFLSAPALGSFAICVLAADPRERRAALCLGAVLELVRAGFCVEAGWPAGAVLPGVGAGLGLVAAATFVRRAVLATEPRPRMAALDTLAAALVVPVCGVVMPFFLWATAVGYVAVYDHVLYGFDASLGFQASGVVARLFAALPPLGAVCGLAYAGLPVALSLAAAAEARRGDPGPDIGLLPASVLAACLGFSLYAALPGMGPRYAFGLDFPDHLPDAQALGAALFSPGPTAPRNSSPSLHATWALLILLAARRLPRPARAASWAFLGATLLATLGLGEHYAVDLVLALPLTLLVRALCAVRAGWCAERAGATAAGALILAGWFTLLRLGGLGPTTPSGLAWAMVACTGAACVVLERRLAHAAYGRTRDPTSAPGVIAWPASWAARPSGGRRLAT